VDCLAVKIFKTDGNYDCEQKKNDVYVASGGQEPFLRKKVPGPPKTFGYLLLS